MTIAFVEPIDEDTYQALRNEQVKMAENSGLMTGGAHRGEILDDSTNRVATASGTGNLAIGYGWDIKANGSQALLNAFAQIGISLNADQQATLIGYATNDRATVPTVSRADFLAAWAGFSLSEAQATELLNIAFETREAAISEILGIHDLPFSEERAAIMSQYYNMQNHFPDAEIRNLKETSFDAIAAYDSRAEVWWNIVYQSNGGSSAGVQSRRIAEGNLFGLFTDDGAPREF